MVLARPLRNEQKSAGAFSSVSITCFHLGGQGLGSSVMIPLLMAVVVRVWTATHVPALPVSWQRV